MTSRETPRGTIFVCRGCEMEILRTEDIETIIKLPLYDPKKVPEFHSEDLWINGKRVPYYFLGYYLPQNKTQQDEFSKSVLDFKKGYLNVISKFAEDVVNLIRFKKLKPDIIIPIPSSKKGEISLGHKLLVDYVSNELKIKNGTRILQRWYSVQKSHLASPNKRPIERDHYLSITCKQRLENMKVVLFDDILTTGDTARACVRIIFECGASKVYLITLARTKLVR
ncbi:hypothetical protein PFC_05770 [Pyrococcus furiosus COM1]|nr:hypothetical protein PFC_05770 [Pyrococcus furiosus COM1]